MRTTVLLAIGLVFLSLALLGTIYGFILQIPEELRSAVYIPALAAQPSATSASAVEPATPTSTVQAGKPTSAPVPKTPTMALLATATVTRTPTLSATPSPTNEAFGRVTLCVNSLYAHTINVRSGPGTNYAPLGKPLPVGTCVVFSARNEEGTWLQIALDQPDPTLQQYEGGWIFRELLGISTEGPVDLPAVTLTPTLNPSETDMIVPTLVLTDTASLGSGDRIGTSPGVWAPSLSFDMPLSGARVRVNRVPSKASQSDHYLVEAEWPVRIEVKHPGRIRVSLIRTSEGYTPTVELPGSTAVVFTPIPVFGSTPGATLDQAFGEQYKASATAYIAGSSFDIEALQAESQSLDQPRINWIWSISSDNPGKNQGIEIKIEIKWERTGNAQDSLKRDIWSDHIEIDVFQRLVAAGQINAFSLLSGSVGSALSIPWLYQKISERRPRLQKKGKKRTYLRQLNG